MPKKTMQAYCSVWAKKIRAINLLGGKCSYCEEKRPWVLSFHHDDPGDKKFNFNHIRECRWSIIEKEIKKCKLVCFNCHNEIHFMDIDTKPKRNKKFCLEFKNSKGCEICGYNKCNDSLEFHHLGEKNFWIADVSKLKVLKSIRDISERLKKELNLCKILCSNCHRDIHFNKNKFLKYKEFIENFTIKERPLAIEKNVVLQLYKEGLKQNDISKILGCTKSTICGILDKLIGKRYLNKKHEIPTPVELKRCRQFRTRQDWLNFILESIVKTEKNCWLWQGRLDKYGKGRIVFLNTNHQPKEISTHKLVYEHFKGNLPTNLYLYHSCENMNCCNPEHLYVITAKELGQNRAKKGQVYKTSGEKSGVHKLTALQVLEIRNDNRKLLEIAKDFNVAKSTISMIKNMKSRRDG